MNALEGQVFRRFRYEVEEEQINREAEAISNEYQQLKEEFQETMETDKATINASIEKLKIKAKIVVALGSMQEIRNWNCSVA